MHSGCDPFLRIFPCPLRILIALLSLGTCAGESVVALSGAACNAQKGKEYCPADGRCHPDGICDDCRGHLTLDIDTHECVDRQVFQSHAALDIIAAVIWFIGAGLAMSAGVGGGGIYVPLGVILLRFASKPSTGLSQASIFGASLAGLLINIRSRHPKADRPVIDLDMALFLAPMEMAGALLGVIVQRILPTWAVIVLMATILGYTAFKTFQKGIKTLKKEWAAKKAATVETPVETMTAVVETKELESADDEAKSESKGIEAPSGVIAMEAWAAPAPHVGRRPSEKVKWAPALPELGQTKTGRLSADEWLAAEAAFPTRSLCYLGLMWVTFIVLLIVKGGKGTKGLVTYCSPSYWLVTAVSFLWLFGFALCMGYRAVRKTVHKFRTGFPFVEGDVIWSWRKFRFYSIMTFSAGVVAGLIGIGGGMVLGPLMLQLGVLPQVSSATTATMIVLTSSSAALIYVTGGLVPMGYAASFFIIAFVGGYVGKTFIDGLVKKYQMASIIVLILASIIAFASSTMTLNGVLIYSDRDWDFDGFQPMC